MRDNDKVVQVDFPRTESVDVGGGRFVSIPSGVTFNFTYAELRAAGIDPLQVDGVGEIEPGLSAKLLEVVRERGGSETGLPPGDRFATPDEVKKMFGEEEGDA